MTEHPDAELLSLGHDLELLFKADEIVLGGAHYDTRTAVSPQAVKIMKAIHRLQPSTIEGVAVKLRAICFDFADFIPRTWTSGTGTSPRSSLDG